jgi:hypothetical protein
MPAGKYPAFLQFGLSGTTCVQQIADRNVLFVLCFLWGVTFLYIQEVCGCS